MKADQLLRPQPVAARFRGSVFWLLVLFSSAVTGMALSRGGIIAALFVVAALGGALFILFADIGYQALLAWTVLSVIAFPLVRYPRAQTIITFDRAWIVAMISCLLFTAREVPKTRATRGIFWAFGAIVMAFGLRAVTTSADTFNPLATWVDAIVLPFIVFALASRVMNRVELVQRLVGVLAIAGLILAAIGLSEKVLGYQLATLSGGVPRLDIKLGFVRISGPYADPEPYALSLILCLAATLVWAQLRGRAYYALGLIASLVQLMAIGITFFRAAWVGAIVVVVFALGVRPRRAARLVGVACIVGAMLLLILVPFDRTRVGSTRISDTANIKTRLATYLIGLEVFRKSPWVGVGVNQFSRAEASVRPQAVGGVVNQTFPHSSYVGILAEQGIGTFTLFIVLTFAVGWLIHSFRQRSRTYTDTVLGSALLGSALAYLIMSVTLNMLPFGPSNAFFALLLGTAAARLDAIAYRGSTGGEPQSLQTDGSRSRLEVGRPTGVRW